MSAVQTWRVGLTDGSVAEVDTVVRVEASVWRASWRERGAHGLSAHDAVQRLSCVAFPGAVVEILAPGVPSRAELIAERDRAVAGLDAAMAGSQRLVAEAAELRSERAELTAQRDAWRGIAMGGTPSPATLDLIGRAEYARCVALRCERVDAVLTPAIAAQRDAVATAWREGAEAMREACAATLNAHFNRGMAHGTTGGRLYAAALSDAESFVRALPIPTRPTEVPR